MMNVTLKMKSSNSDYSPGYVEIQIPNAVLEAVGLNPKGELRCELDEDAALLRLDQPYELLPDSEQDEIKTPASV